MLYLELGANKGYYWEHIDDTYVLGSLSEIDKSNLVQLLHRLIENRDNTDGIISELNELEGFYSAVCMQDDQCVLITDHLSSFPIFYSDCEDGFIVSDDVNCLINSSTELDEGSIIQFKASFTTSPGRTLWKRIQEVPSGTCVILGERISVIPYNLLTRSLRGNKKNADDVRNLAESVFSPIVEKYSNRTIVLPITSGVDSRSVAVLLREYGVNDIVSFSIGSKNDEDVVVGSKIASRLGIPWEHIELDADSWEGFLSSQDFTKMLNYSLGGGRLNHVLMAHAMLRMQEAGLIPEQSVFMPGHAGAVMGGELKQFATFKGTKPRSRIADEIQEIESRTGRMKVSQDRLVSVLEDRYELIIPEHCDYIMGCEIADTVHMRDYICKFIVNDVRNYDFFGYEWYLPLITQKWCSFWMESSYEDVYKKELMKSYLETFSSIRNIGYGNSNQSLYAKFKRIIANNALSKKLATRLISNIRLFQSDPSNGYFSFLDREGLRELALKHRNAKELINAVFVEKVLNLVDIDT